MAESVGPAAVAESIRRGSPILDVRATADYVKGFVPGSRFLPFRPGLMARQAAAWWPNGVQALLVASDDGVAKAAEEELAAAHVHLTGIFAGSAADLRAAGIVLDQVDEWEVDEAHRRMAEGAQLLDVREPSEWAAGHAPGAVWIPLGQVESRSGELERSATWGIICASGVRSARAAAALQAAGFKDVHSVRGGMHEWLRQGLPTER